MYCKLYAQKNINCIAHVWWRTETAAHNEHDCHYFVIKCTECVHTSSLTLSLGFKMPVLSSWLICAFQKRPFSQKKGLTTPATQKRPLCSVCATYRIPWKISCHWLTQQRITIKAGFPLATASEQQCSSIADPRERSQISSPLIHSVHSPSLPCSLFH